MSKSRARLGLLCIFAGLSLVSACGGKETASPEGAAGSASAGAGSEPDAGCSDSGDCAVEQFCRAGACHADICEPGERSCGPSAVLQCTTDGGLFEKVRACGAGAACTVDDDGVPGCNDSLCAPGTTKCLPDDVVGACSDDGRRFDATRDCAAEGDVCVDGACQDRICEPNVEYCKHSVVYACDALGTSERVTVACSASSPCNPSTATCEDRVCNPLEVSCQDNVIHTCNESGHEDAPGQDCGDLTCSLGQCVDCVDVNIRDALRFLQIRKTHIYIYNRSGCLLDLEGVGFDIAYYSPDIQDVRVDVNLLPSWQLPPDAFVALAFVKNVPDTIYVDGKGPFDDGRDAYVLLCDGECMGSNVIDAVKIGEAAPELPSPVSFAGELTPDMLTQYMSREWSFAGSYPRFTASDWTIHQE